MNKKELTNKEQETLQQEIKEILTQHVNECITVSKIVKETGAFIGPCEDALLSLKEKGLYIDSSPNVIEINGRTLVIFYSFVILKNSEMDSR